MFSKSKNIANHTVDLISLVTKRKTDYTLNFIKQSTPSVDVNNNLILNHFTRETQDEVIRKLSSHMPHIENLYSHEILAYMRSTCELPPGCFGVVLDQVKLEQIGMAAVDYAVYNPYTDMLESMVEWKAGFPGSFPTMCSSLPIDYGARGADIITKGFLDWHRAGEWFYNLDEMGFSFSGPIPVDVHPLYPLLQVSNFFYEEVDILGSQVSNFLDNQVSIAESLDVSSLHERIINGHILKKTQGLDSEGFVTNASIRSIKEVKLIKDRLTEDPGFLQAFKDVNRESLQQVAQWNYDYAYAVQDGLELVIPIIN